MTGHYSLLTSGTYRSKPKAKTWPAKCCTTNGGPMPNVLVGIFDWIHSDYKTNRIRFFVEVLAWGISIGCSITMAATVPNPPLLVMYPIWIAGCAMYAWASYTRRSFGMLANYILLTTIDSVGLARMLLLS